MENIDQALSYNLRKSIRPTLKAAEGDDNFQFLSRIIGQENYPNIDNQDIDRTLEPNAQSQNSSDTLNDSETFEINPNAIQTVPKESSTDSPLQGQESLIISNEQQQHDGGKSTEKRSKTGKALNSYLFLSIGAKKHKNGSNKKSNMKDIGQEES